MSFYEDTDRYFTRIAWLNFKCASEVCMAEPNFDRKLQRSATSFSQSGGFRQRLSNLTLPRRANAPEPTNDTRGPSGLRALTDPQDPFVELIFVHGLHGDSRRTWTPKDDTSKFWPLWLQVDPEDRFSHVRCHSFGYSADWADRRASVDKIHDFGILLLESLINGTHLKREANNPIVFIAHSLGGLVVKKALNLAKQNPEYYDVTRRVHTIFFLATPHRGADSPVMLNNILRATTINTRGHVSDLEPNSSAIESINEMFRLNYHGTRLRSFFETMPTSSSYPPGTTNLVVEKHSSVLGLPEERAIPLNTDHAGVCSFESPDDPSYVVLSDVLAGTVDEIVGDLMDPVKIRDQMQSLADYLGVSEDPEEELFTFEDAQVPGTCDWLLQKQSYKTWQDARGNNDDPIDPEPRSRPRNLMTTSNRFRTSPQGPPRFFWLTGAPGTGKSMLAAHVARVLLDRQCSYYFLHHTDKTKQNLSGLLKSLAYQMALRDVALRQSLLAMLQEDGLTAETNDTRAVWRQLFVQKIFLTDSRIRQYWIIDGLDEAVGGHELVPLLARIPEHLPYSIFLTSRRDLRLEKQLLHLPKATEHIEIRDTLGDIRLYLEANTGDFPVDGAAEVQNLIGKLLLRSKGSFLWTRLILQKLATTWSERAIDDALEGIPDGMQELYFRVLQDMAEEDKANRELAKAILRWVVCAARPLTTTELQEAIRLDIGSKVFRFERMIEGVCGQLVTVDRHGRVQLVHDTVRDFLLEDELDSEFAMDKAHTHGHLADICLRYLVDQYSKGQPARRPLVALAEVGTPVFQEYANLYFSEHLVKSPPVASENPMSGLELFLETSILSWTEYIARQHDLSWLTQTAKNLKGYVDRRIDFQSPLNHEMRVVKDWALDLIRLVTVFGRNLRSDPSSIYSIIPPLCPPNSVIFRKFRSSNLGLEVVGLPVRGWSDRISSSSFSPDDATVLACCDRQYAVGLRSGHVVLYDAVTCQETGRLNHGEPITHLQFANGHDQIIVGGKSVMTMWNSGTHHNIWTIDVSSPTLALTVTDDDKTIITATSNNCIVLRNTIDGEEIEEVSWHGNEASKARIRTPQSTYISSELRLLALVYRNEPVILYDLGDLTRPRSFGGHTMVLALAFNPVLNMLAVAFYDGEVRTMGLWNLQEVNSASVDASHLACSPDGKTLVVGMNVGSIQIHDFDTLSVLQTIRFGEEQIVSMLFTGNGLRILDIRRHESNVWEPSALIRRKDSDDSTSEGQTSYSTAPSNLVQGYTVGEEIPITAMIAHISGEYIFCGKENGTVAVYETLRGKFVRDLYSHVKTEVNTMDWNAAKEALVSSDSSSRIMVHKVKEVQTRSSAGPKSTWQAQKILEKRIDEAIQQVLLSTDGEFLLVSTTTSDQLLTLDGKTVLSLDRTQLGQTRTPSQKWTTHPGHKRKLFEIDTTGVKTIEWEKYRDAPPVIGTVSVEPDERIDFGSRDFGVHFVKIGDDSWAAYDNNPFTRPLLWTAPPSSLRVPDATAAALAHFRLAVPAFKSIIGMFRSQLVFVDLDGWICSLRLDSVAQEKRTWARHFPLPHCWQSSSRRLVALVTSKGEVVVTKGDNLAVVKRGLSVESIDVSANGGALGRSSSMRRNRPPRRGELVDSSSFGKSSFVEYG